MKISVIGRGLIGGSLMKAAARAGHDVVSFDRGDDFAVETSDFVFVAVPPGAVVKVMKTIAPRLRDGTVVTDVTGVKRHILEQLYVYADETRWSFIGGHPMAGREKTGFVHSLATLFDGASMILTPFPHTPDDRIASLRQLLGELGFARVVIADPAHHDKMIAYTSQLCHLISSAYVREPLSSEHVGYSAGSFRDMVRVGAPDPSVWTELFFANRDHLLAVLDRYVARLDDFRTALATNDRMRMLRALEEGVAAKRIIAGDNQEP